MTRDEEVADLRARIANLEQEILAESCTSDALKIVLNSTFGKLNDVWSPLRSVPNAMRVTINGQLFLLMLIEHLHHVGFTILSANTDGVTFQMPKTTEAETDLAFVIKRWQTMTGFELERNDYTVYARRDVNSYVARDVKGKIKLKGAFQPDTGKGDGLVIKKAAVAFLTKGTPIVDTVRSAGFSDFVFYQRCKNGGTLLHGGAPIGRLARWYASENGQPIRRQNPNGTLATLPHGHSASLVMNLDDFAMDIDLGHYIREAQALVNSCTL